MYLILLDKLAKGLAFLPLEREIVNSTCGRVIPNTIIKMVPTAAWQVMLQYTCTDMNRESNFRDYQLTSPQLYPLLKIDERLRAKETEISAALCATRVTRHGMTLTLIYPI
jgi:hypothetical protein